MTNNLHIYLKTLTSADPSSELSFNRSIKVWPLVLISNTVLGQNAVLCQACQLILLKPWGFFVTDICIIM